MGSDARIQELEAQVAQLTAAMAAMRDERTVESFDTARTSSRRGMLKLAGAAAAGAAVGLTGKVGQVAAADGQPISASQSVDTSPGTRASTELLYTNSSFPQIDGSNASNIFMVRDTPSSPGANDSRSSTPAAIAGYAYRAVAHGVYGYAGSAGAGYGVIGFGASPLGTGVLARGSRANLELFADGPAPSSRNDAHTRGELIADSDGNTWVCVATGTPGTWRKLGGPATAGSFHPVAPGRVYDSRAGTPSPTGRLANNTSRAISVADKRDGNTGVVTQANFVPAGATAISCNITVANTTASGFLNVVPAGSGVSQTAAINWYTANQILNNGVILAINPANRQIDVTAGGGGSTDFIIDVTGYFL